MAKVAYLFLFIWMELPSHEWTGVIVFHDYQVLLAFQRQLFFENLALVLHDAKVRFFVPIKQDLNRPGPRENLGVFHSRPVDNVIRAIECVSLHDVQLIAVVVSRRCRTRLDGSDRR